MAAYLMKMKSTFGVALVKSDSRGNSNATVRRERKIVLA
jgi:hypothetical protein